MKGIKLNCKIEIQNEKDVIVQIKGFDSKDNSLSQVLLYLDKNLENAITHLVFQLITDELQASFSRGQKRKDILEGITNQQKKSVRSRVKAGEKYLTPEIDFLINGKVSKIPDSVLKKGVKNLVEERTRYIQKFGKALEHLMNEDIKPTKKNIAEVLYSKHSSNPHQSLRRDLKRLYVNYERTLDIYNLEN